MTVKKIVMPKLGESVTEGTINAWLVKEGDFVNKYDPIAEVMTDKVNAEVPSSYSGTIKEIVIPEGTTVAVDDLIGYIEIDDKQSKEDTVHSFTKSTPHRDVIKDEKETEQEETDTSSIETKKNMRYSPAVIRLATEHNIDLSTISGTGLGGRITRKDVHSFIENMSDSTLLAKEQPKEIPSIEETITNKPIETFATDREIPVTGVRKAIAENMVKAKQEIPHAWMTVEVDVTDLVALREKVKGSFKQREGFTLTYFSFFVYAVAQALQKYRPLNSTWAGDKIIERGNIHLSIAVAKDNELFVPVIKNADEKNVKGIAKSIHQLAEKTRSGTLTPSDMNGGTFTINNTGTFGSVSSMGIINYPQAAILQIESIVKRPVIINNMFAARDIVNLSLSLDHRILDGLICGRFLAYVKEILENINENTLTI